MLYSGGTLEKVINMTIHYKQSVDFPYRSRYRYQCARRTNNRLVHIEGCVTGRVFPHTKKSNFT